MFCSKLYGYDQLYQCKPNFPRSLTSHRHQLSHLELSSAKQQGESLIRKGYSLENSSGEDIRRTSFSWQKSRELEWRCMFEQLQVGVSWHFVTVRSSPGRCLCYFWTCHRGSHHDESLSCIRADHITADRKHREGQRRAVPYQCPRWLSWTATSQLFIQI